MEYFLYGLSSFLLIISLFRFLNKEYYWKMDPKAPRWVAVSLATFLASMGKFGFYTSITVVVLIAITALVIWANSKFIPSKWWNDPL